MRGKLFAYLKIILGSCIYAFGFRLFLFPNEIVPGGVTGVAMIINYLTGAPVGILTIALNVPIFIIAWRVIGRRFPHRLTRRCRCLIGGDRPDRSLFKRHHP